VGQKQYYEEITFGVDTSASLTKEEIEIAVEMAKDCKRRSRWYYRLFKSILNDRKGGKNEYKL
jgi:hypothetical protein